MAGRADRARDSRARNGRLAGDRRGDRPRVRQARRHARAARTQARAARRAGGAASRRRPRSAGGRRDRPRLRRGGGEGVRPRGRRGRERRHHPLPPVRAAAARRGSPHERRELARHDLHGVDGAAGHDRERPRPHRGRLLGRRCARLPLRRRLQRDEGRAARLRRGAAPRARGHRRVGHDRVPGRDRHLAARPRAGPHAGLVPHGSPRAGRAARASRWSRRSRTTSASSSIRRSSACCGSPTGSRRGSATSCSGASSAGARRRDDASAEAAPEAAAREVGAASCPRATSGATSRSSTASGRSSSATATT